jgi:hypothetical protein
MKTNPFLLLAGICAAGLLSGYAVKRISGNSAAPPPPADPAANGLRARGGAAVEVSPATAAVLKSVGQSTIRSSDTLESVKALDGADRYARLALWMVDASEPEIAAYWQHYRQQAKRENEITDLIFINWTRIDPRAATAAAKGTGDEHYAWWAWACHDPKGALEAAVAENPDRVNNVTWGIGEFHKDWLREHFDELPEDARNNALQGMAKWDDGEDPLATLEFLKEKGYGFHAGIFKVLIRKDPWAAYDWIEANGSSVQSEYGGSFDAMATFVETVGEQYPDVLKRIADQAPSGEMKRQLEGVLFANLLKTDPEAAIEQARTTEAPVIAVQRLAAAGLSLIQTDPERAFELAADLFASDPDALSGTMSVETPGGGSGWGVGTPGVDQLIDALVSKDPARAMAMNLSWASESLPESVKGPITMPPNREFSLLAMKWAERDVAAYSEWVTGQQDPKVREPAAAALINQLQQGQQYDDAAAWAMSLEQSRFHQVQNVVMNWRQSSPEDALQWLENSQLPAGEIQQIKTSLGIQP